MRHFVKSMPAGAMMVALVVHWRPMYQRWLHG